MNLKTIILLVCLIVLVPRLMHEVKAGSFLKNGFKKLCQSIGIISSKASKISSASTTAISSPISGVSTAESALPASTATTRQSQQISPQTRSDVNVANTKQGATPAATIRPELGVKTFVLGEHEERIALASCDWRKVHAVTEVKNQWMCKTCTAFAAIGVIEAYFKRTRNLSKAVRLSEQYMYECSGKPVKKLLENFTKCTRGMFESIIFEFAQKYGVRLESTDPYHKIMTGHCASNKLTFKLYEMQIWEMAYADEDTIKEVVYRYGPATCRLSLPETSNIFDIYTNGLFNCKKSKWLKTFLHSVLIVGYDTDPKLGDYWIIKNSLGTSWGEKGYLKVARNQNACNITQLVYFVT